MPFNEKTKILYLNHSLKDEYIRIECLRKGDVVKTYRHGYRKIDAIGRNIVINKPGVHTKCMYIMEKTGSNGLLEDLIMLGNHSILVDDLGEYQPTNEQLWGGTTPTLDKKYLLLAAASSQFVPVQNTKPHVYYNLVLDNENDDEVRFGIWANGILTETPSKKLFAQQKIIVRSK
jgi:hypothetical protein